MKREFLKSLGVDGLTDDIIQKIMTEHGTTVEANKKAHEQAIAAAHAERDARPNITTASWEAAQGDLSLARESLKSFEGIDVNALQADLSAAQRAMEESAAQQAKQTSAMAVELLLREKLATETFTSNYARNGVFADLKGKVAYEPGEDGAIGTITGFDDAIAEIRESNPTAFAVSDATPPKPKAEGKQHKSGGDYPPKKREIPLLI